MTIDFLLQKIFYYDNRHAITVKDAAEVTGKHERQIYYYIEGERLPDVEFLHALSMHLVKQYGDTRIAEFFLPAGWLISPAEVKTDGRIVDEVMEIDEAEGEAIRAYRNGDYSTVIQSGEKIITLGKRLRMEAESKIEGRS